MVYLAYGNSTKVILVVNLVNIWDNFNDDTENFRGQ